MPSDLDVLTQFLQVALNTSEPIFDRFAKLPNRQIVFRGDRPNRFLYIRGERTNKVLLVAHADTVWDNDRELNDKPDPELLLTDGIFHSSSSTYGIGADDRAGCAILWLLKDMGHSLLITDGEEFGGFGSTWLMHDPQNADIADELNQDHQFMIQFDRRHGTDFKCYSVGTDEFRLYLQQVTGYSEPNRSAYTDIVTLCRTITGVNLSVGYRKEHSCLESLSIQEWQHTLDLCRTWLANPDLPRFPLYSTATPCNYST